MPLVARVVRQIQQHVLTWLDHHPTIPFDPEVDEGQIGSREDLFHLARVQSSLELPSHEGEKQKHNRDQGERSRKGKPRVQPSIGTMHHHPNDEEVVEQVGVREELPLPVSDTGERTSPYQHRNSE